VKKILLQKKQFLLYCVIGASGVTLDFGIYSLLVKNPAARLSGANAAGYSSGTLLSFILNARFNFRVTTKSPAAHKFFQHRVSWLARFRRLLHLLIGRFNFDKYLSKFATLIVVVLLQYNLNRLLSFRKAS